MKAVYTGGAKPEPGTTKADGKDIFVAGKQQTGKWIYCGDKVWRKVGTL